MSPETFGHLNRVLPMSGKEKFLEGGSDISYRMRKKFILGKILHRNRYSVKIQNLSDF